MEVLVSFSRYRLADFTFMRIEKVLVSFSRYKDAEPFQGGEEVSFSFFQSLLTLRALDLHVTLRAYKS